MSPRLIFVVNDAGFFLSHRLSIAVAARDAGFEVHVATMAGEAVQDVVANGFTHYELPLTRNGINPFVELRALWSLIRLFWTLKPDLVHLVTIKPVLYGGTAARLTGVRAVVAAVSGLGMVYTDRGARANIRRAIVRRLYRFAMHQRNICMVFQNPVDRAKLVDAGVVASENTLLLPGSGVDLTEYRHLPEPTGIPTVTMAARLLKEKGIEEFVEAARLLRQSGIAAQFQLVGDADFGNASSVSYETLNQWRVEGTVTLPGRRRDIAQIFAASNLVVLPSYYGEGLPKVLAEAASCGRAVVTTDMPGCRDAIEPGTTGLLVPARDGPALAAAIRLLLEDAALRSRMGDAGRRLAERRFAVGSIVSAHLELYASLLAR